MRVVFVSSEVYPFIKTGGLADVSQAIPKALVKKGIETISIMPLYLQVDKEKFEIKKLDFEIVLKIGQKNYNFNVFTALRDGVRHYFLHNSFFFDRTTIYGNYFDNDLRFGLFDYAVVELVKLLNFEPDIYHLNDWQCGLIPLILKKKSGYNGKVIFLVHNFAYQGVFKKDCVDRLGIGWDNFHMDDIEFYDNVNFLKSAIANCDKLVTVSKSHAQEVCQKGGGFGLDGAIAQNAHKLTGLQNGLDTDEFDPSSDPYIYQNYSSSSYKNRERNKAELCKELGIKEPSKPLYVYLGRLTYQKGIDFIVETADDISRLDINLIVLGEGEQQYVDALIQIDKECENIYPILGYKEALARKLYAAADFLVMPSIFEPSGLNQLIAMRYGAFPIVRKTGGLKDTVFDYLACTDADPKGVGIVFESIDTVSFLLSLHRAYSLYQNRQRLRDFSIGNMVLDHSWDKRINDYIELYNN